MSTLSIAELIEEDIRYMSAGLPPDGYRPAGSEFSSRMGFTAERFEGYLWEAGDTCYLSLVVSKQPGQGHLSEVIANLADSGFHIKVPTPLGSMQDILKKKGFQPSPEDPTMWVQEKTAICI